MENKEIEEILLGKLIVKPKLLDKYSQLLHKDLFEYPFNKSVYHALMDLHSSARTIDILTVSKLIKGDNVALELSYLTDRAWEFTEIITCIGILTEEFQKRTLTGIVHNVHNQLSNREELELIIAT